MAHQKDFTMHVGLKYGKLTITKIVRMPKKVLAECVCDCGNTTDSTVLSRLINGNITSCKKCSNKLNGDKGRVSRREHSQYSDLVGQVINYFTVLSRADLSLNEPGGTFKCRCICGNIRFLDACELRENSDRKSCGCQQSRLLSLSQGGTGIPYASTDLNDVIRKSTSYDKWTKACLKKANYTCFISGIYGGDFHIHHIIPLGQLIRLYGITKYNWRQFKTKIFSEENGVVLTKELHQSLHQKYGKYPTIADIIEFKNEYLNSMKPKQD